MVLGRKIGLHALTIRLNNCKTIPSRKFAGKNNYETGLIVLKTVRQYITVLTYTWDHQRSTEVLQLFHWYHVEVVNLLMFIFTFVQQFSDQHADVVTWCRYPTLIFNENYRARLQKCRRVLALLSRWWFHELPGSIWSKMTNVRKIMMIRVLEKDHDQKYDHDKFIFLLTIYPVLSYILRKWARFLKKRPPNDTISLRYGLIMVWDKAW